MTEQEALERFRKQLNSAQCVLDSGFGTNPGENDRLYRTRRDMAEIAINAIQKQIPQEPTPYKGWEGQCPSCGVIFVDR